uniref:Probable cytosolic iron-sulfur protein assembly protein CIAO1 homolog n=1 Tax=Meloidogyne incognita TaxID=6306 RepID=A0A914KTI9_MELIC
MSTSASSSQIVRHVLKVCHVDEQQLYLSERVWACAWHFSGKLIASAGEDKTIKIWKCEEEENKQNNGEIGTTSEVSPLSISKIGTIRGDQTRSIRWVCFSPCGKFLAAASFDATIIIYERNKISNEFEELHKLEGHECEVKCCSFSISGHYLATCSRDKTVWIWKVPFENDDDDYEVLSILQQHTADVKFVVWHPREDILVSGGYDCSIRFYIFDGDEWVTAQAIADAHSETVWSATFDNLTGQHLATVGGDKTIKIWSKEKRPEEGQSWCSWKIAVNLPILETRWPLYAVVWNCDGIIAVGGGDCLVRLFVFDVENSALSLLSSIRLPSEINCLAWRPKQQSEQTKNYLAVASDDGHLHFLQIDSQYINDGFGAINGQIGD